MKTCTKCGKKFNIWRTLVGEYRQHVRTCQVPDSKTHRANATLNCRGCPAECFKDVDYTKGPQ